MIRAIAWDIDGTLVDSEPLHEEALMAVTAAAVPGVSRLDGGRFRGIHMADVWQLLAPEIDGRIDEAAWTDRILDHFVAGAAVLRPLPGALAVMEAFAAAGLVQVAVSNSQRRVVEANLAAIGAGAHLAFSLAYEDVPAGKPDPAPYRMAAARLGLPPHAVAAVEDSATGAASARAAGLRVFGIAPEGGTVPGAEHTVASLADLAPLIMPPHARQAAGGAD